MNFLELAELEKKAKKATLGPWVPYINTLVDGGDVRAGHETIVVATGNCKNYKNNLEYVSYVSPKAILELIKNLREARRMAVWLATELGVITDKLKNKDDIHPCKLFKVKECAYSYDINKCRNTSDCWFAVAAELTSKVDELKKSYER